ncbi:TetR-like C-terminal domain-containing protein [Micromonospora sp. KLBMP9576]|uniref:TetR-like C-terminal domain-containing protein n=1 Tax=Micromonospora sp. KLBMP9576 TaxID=3424769 RepID=UPI003D8C566C
MSAPAPTPPRCRSPRARRRSAGPPRSPRPPRRRAAGRLPPALAALAKRFGVRDASLYTHIRGLADLQERVALLALTEWADALGAAVAGRCYALLRGYDLSEPDATDAVRLLRSTLHGFSDLEALSGFTAGRSVDASWRRAVDTLHHTLANWSKI